MWRALSGLTLLLPGWSLACTCPPGPYLSDDLVIETLCETELVFVGRAVQLLEVRPTMAEHKIVPLQIFKGAPANPTFAISQSNCDWYFRPGVDYIIFANPEDDSDYLSPHMCGLTTAVVVGEKIIGVLSNSLENLDDLCEEPASSQRKARLRAERFSSGEDFGELVEETRRQLNEE